LQDDEGVQRNAVKIFWINSQDKSIIQIKGKLMEKKGGT
jgi:hypothetical protein